MHRCCWRRGVSWTPRDPRKNGSFAKKMGIRPVRDGGLAKQRIPAIQKGFSIIFSKLTFELAFTDRPRRRCGVHGARFSKPRAQQREPPLAVFGEGHATKHMSILFFFLGKP
jgi:hypothetical protein